MPKNGGERSRPRIIDVARLAGVSPQTVSNVVNERGGFTSETRAKVLDAVGKTGYRPNRAARQLRTNRARQVGFLLENENFDPRNPFTLSVLREVLGICQSRSQRVVSGTVERDDPEALNSWAEAADVDGFVFCNVSPGDPRTEALGSLGVPFAVMGRTSPDQSQSWVDIDNRTAMTGVVDYLVGKGHRSFAFADLDNVQGHPHWSVDRYEGTRDRLLEHDCSLESDVTLIGDYESLAKKVDHLLENSKRPSAVICGSDAVALIVIRRARIRGLRVGEDIAVTGFDGADLLWFAEVPLTTVRIPIERIADKVITRLMKEIEQGPTDDPGEIVPTSLIIGDSA